MKAGEFNQEGVKKGGTACVTPPFTKGVGGISFARHQVELGNEP